MPFSSIFWLISACPFFDFVFRPICFCSLADQCRCGASNHLQRCAGELRRSVTGRADPGRVALFATGLIVCVSIQNQLYLRAWSIAAATVVRSCLVGGLIVGGCTGQVLCSVWLAVAALLMIRQRQLRTGSSGADLILPCVATRAGPILAAAVDRCRVRLVFRPLRPGARSLCSAGFRHGEVRDRTRQWWSGCTFDATCTEICPNDTQANVLLFGAILVSAAAFDRRRAAPNAGWPAALRCRRNRAANR